MQQSYKFLCCLYITSYVASNARALVCCRGSRAICDRNTQQWRQSTRQRSLTIMHPINGFITDRLSSIRRSYGELTERLNDPYVLGDPKMMISISQERSKLEDIVTDFNAWESITKGCAEAKDMFELSTDPELRELYREEVKFLESKIAVLETSLMKLIIPRDPHDDKNVMVEIRAGTGGGEGSFCLFN